MELVIKAPTACKVVKIFVVEGEFVEASKILVEIEPIWSKYSLKFVGFSWGLALALKIFEFLRDKYESIISLKWVWICLKEKYNY